MEANRYAKKNRSTLVPALTPREQQVVSLIQKGCSNKEIAASLGVGACTARDYVSNIKQKAGVCSVVVFNKLGDLSDSSWCRLMLFCEPSISSAEAQVLRFLCKGNSSKRIGQLLSVSPRTVDKHRQHLLSKTRVSSTRQLLAWLCSQYAMCGVDP
ncbi:LuxR C-terminal-related transcriptional regulator [Pseudomonas putida]